MIEKSCFRVSFDSSESEKMQSYLETIFHPKMSVKHKPESTH